MGAVRAGVAQWHGQQASLRTDSRKDLKGVSGGALPLRKRMSKPQRPEVERADVVFEELQEGLSRRSVAKREKILGGSRRRRLTTYSLCFPFECSRKH